MWFRSRRALLAGSETYRRGPSRPRCLTVALTPTFSSSTVYIYMHASLQSMLLLVEAATRRVLIYTIYRFGKSRARRLFCQPRSLFQKISTLMAPVMTSDNISKGRVAVTNKTNASLGIPSGSWSVVVSDGVKEKQPPQVSPQGANWRRTKVADLIFFVSKFDRSKSLHISTGNVRKLRLRRGFAAAASRSKEL